MLLILLTALIHQANCFSGGDGSAGNPYQISTAQDLQDMNNDLSLDVKAVRSGTLYRGSYSGSGSCQLRYVRVDHDDSDLDTLYLHINY